MVKEIYESPVMEITDVLFADVMAGKGTSGEGEVKTSDWDSVEIDDGISYSTNSNLDSAPF